MLSFRNCQASCCRTRGASAWRLSCSRTPARQSNCGTPRTPERPTTMVPSVTSLLSSARSVLWLRGFSTVGWKIWIPSTQQILISRDVHFDESICYKDVAPNQHINLIDPSVSPYDYFDLNKDTFPEFMEGTPELEDYQDDQENRMEDEFIEQTTSQDNLRANEKVPRRPSRSYNA